MDEDSPKKGWLSGAFKKVAYWCTVTLAVAIVGNLFWQMILDPLFFPVIHDVTNTTAQGWVLFINDLFSPVMDFLGFTGDGGLLKTEFAQSFLGPYNEQVAMATQNDILNAVQNNAPLNMDGAAPDVDDLVNDFLK